jgi:putative ABC transport system substrate-binding protein
MPVIGMLSASSPSSREHLVTAFRRGIREGGYVEDQTVTIEYQWAENQYDRLPRLAANLVQRRVAVIAATDTPSALAAKSTTSAVPGVFASSIGLAATLPASLF